MKKILLFLLTAFITLNLFSQSPLNFKYQAVVRDSDGVVLSDRNVGVNIKIIQNSAEGTSVYEEEFAVSTNAFGLINLVIGTGNDQIGSLANIDWESGPYFLEFSIDIDGGTNYEVMGTSQLLSVPYAIHSKSVDAESIKDLFTYYYADKDNDNFGNLYNLVLAFEQPEGYVANNSDCNDLDNNINPEVEEICDGIDNNCNGEIDEGLTLLFYYSDNDHDGYGDPNSIAVESCSQPYGYASDNTDCDDSNDNVNPGAEEICDGIDNNCNGEIDEGFTLINYYPDNDLDGYGANNSEPVVSCFQPDGYADNNLDCDDSNSNIYPGADEVCNGIDDNCDGVVDEDTGGEVCENTNSYGTATGTMICDDGYLTCDAGDPVPEICDGRDNDYDGDIDEGYDDIDGDGLAWCVDDDDDGDGILDINDNCPNTYNPDQIDSNGDGTGDECEDYDGDGVPDIYDNCPYIPNSDQTDSNGDGLGDACDADGDGVTDYDDNCELHFNPDQSDVDQDGIGDACEDSDADGIVDGEDNCPNTYNPDQADTDDDGIGDVCDTDDSDADGILDADDNCPSVYNPDQTDTDGDGLGDVCDDDIDDDGHPNDTDCDPFDPLISFSEGDPCDDGNICTINDVIDEACNCVGTEKNCDDGDPSTYDECDPVTGLCIHTPIDCDDNNPCTIDYFDPITGCVYSVTTGESCDDGNPCTINDQCLNGECIGTLIDCDDGDPSTIDECDPATGDCIHTQINCDDNNPCTIDYFDPITGCVYTIASNGTACDDGDPCTTNDQCQNGVCVGTPIDCDDGDPCTIDVCDSETGECVHLPKDCDDGDPVTIDYCDSNGNCVHIPPEKTTEKKK